MFDEEENVLATIKNLHESTEYVGPSELHKGEYQKHNINGRQYFTQGQVMQQTVEAQKNLMKHVDLDHLEDLRDEMD